MDRCCVLAAIVVAGCAFQSAARLDAGSGDSHDAAPLDAPPNPCGLPSLALHVATLAGCDAAGTDDGARELARFANPVNVALAPSGIAYIVDFDSSRLRRVEPSGRTSTIVMPPTVHSPFGIALGRTGYLYLETDDDDLGQHSLTTGTIWTVNPATGDATVIARDIGRPRGIAVLADGRLALADHQHQVVELLDPATGAVTLLAGTADTPGHVNGVGAAALFAQPYDLVVLNGDLIVTDFENQVLRRVTLTGVVTDFAGAGAAGHADRAVAAATFTSPKGAAIDASGAIYITESGNHDIRRIANGTVTTFAGTTQPGWRDDDDPALAQFYGVEGLAVSADGTRLVVADGNVGDGMPFNRVRVVHR